MKLIPLSEIHGAQAKSAERSARAKHSTRAEALEASEYRIVSAPGCHSQPSFDPPVIGWVLTRVAAEAIAAQITRMPGGTCHAQMAYEFRG